MPIRDEFLGTLPELRRLIAASGDRWNDTSSLERMTVGDLAAHSARAAANVVRYLAQPVPSVQPDVDAAGYYLGVEGVADIDSATSEAVRERAAADADRGIEAVLERFDANVEALTDTIPNEPASRRLKVLDSMIILLDDYLVTRLVEIVVHADDLASSLDLQEPEFTEAVEDAVIGVLIEIAQRRHGEMAVIRAMTRAERDHIAAMRVL